jgi:hypothetical protein
MPAHGKHAARTPCQRHGTSNLQDLQYTRAASGCKGILRIWLSWLHDNNTGTHQCMHDLSQPCMSTDPSIYLPPNPNRMTVGWKPIPQLNCCKQTDQSNLPAGSLSMLPAIALARLISIRVVAAFSVSEDIAVRLENPIPSHI